MPELPPRDDDAADDAGEGAGVTSGDQELDEPVPAFVWSVLDRVRSVRDRIRLWIYAVLRLLPLEDDLVVLACDSFRSFGGGPRALQEELERSAPGRYRCVWLAKGAAREAMPSTLEVAVPGSINSYRLLARARTIIQEGAISREVVKRSGQRYVQVPPATPIQREGLDLTEFPVAARRANFARLLDDCERWDLLLSSDQHMSEVWERAYPGTYAIVEVGSPRMDVLRRAPGETRSRVRGSWGTDESQQVVLYAPVGRDYWHDDELPVPFSTLADALPEDHVLAVLPPPSVDWDGHLRGRAADDRIVDSRRQSPEEAALGADILLTDYSSIMVPFACLARPVLLLLHEASTFELVRGAYLDLEEEGPGIVLRDVGSLARALREGVHLGSDAERRLHRFARRFCAGVDGLSARRAVGHIFPELDPVSETAEAALSVS